MTSFEIYSKCRSSIAGNRNFDTRKYANELLEKLWNESLNENTAFSNIAFISAVKRMIENAKFYGTIDETQIYVSDAYIFISALNTCIQNGALSYDTISNENLAYLFKPLSLPDTKRKNLLSNTNTVINTIDATIRNDNDRARKTNVQTKEKQTETDISRGKSSMPGCYLRDYGSVLDRHQEGKFINQEGDYIRENHKTENHKTDVKRDATFELKTVDSSERWINARRKENKEYIDKWHSEIDEINNTLRTIQPDISKMLENVMGFSDKITEKYVLHFARMQIELYNLIFDNYVYHKEACNKSGNQDYINAVSNYEEFMYSLSDSLAIFGVEEIVSYSGDNFDGSIHEAETNGFSSRNAIIKKSVRAGFRYKDIIIQKEKVEI